jgi:hypothetical protein
MQTTEETIQKIKDMQDLQYENYGCKYHKETQGVHFGASRDSATIHDGVLTTWNPDENALRANVLPRFPNVRDIFP